MEQYVTDAIEDLVSSKMYSETAFTSLDIANSLKDSGYRVRNREVGLWLRSNAIRVAFGLGCLYNQSLIRVDAKGIGPTLAYLYHHMNDDADNYLDRDQNPKSFQTAPSTPAITAASQIGLVNQSIGRGLRSPNPTPVVVTTVTSVSQKNSSGNDNWKSQRRDDKGRWV